jgi:hypothetical protein
VSDDIPIPYSPRFTWLFLPLRMGPRHSDVRLTSSELHVRMGWAFAAVIPRSSIRWARHADDAPWSVGVHSNLRGRWLVNGFATAIVDLGLEPTARARTGPFPIHVRVLGLGLRDPDTFLKFLDVPERAERDDTAPDEPGPD